MITNMFKWHCKSRWFNLDVALHIRTYEYCLKIKFMNKLLHVFPEDGNQIP